MGISGVFFKRFCGARAAAHQFSLNEMALFPLHALQPHIYWLCSDFGDVTHVLHPLRLRLALHPAHSAEPLERLISNGLPLRVFPGGFRGVVRGVF
jgi:hypothetical protein